MSGIFKFKGNICVQFNRRKCLTKLCLLPEFFQILSTHFDLDEFIPYEFKSAFYLSIGRNRIYPLHGFLSAFILQKIFSIPTYALLLLFLNLCNMRLSPGSHMHGSSPCCAMYHP